MAYVEDPKSTGANKERPYTELDPQNTELTPDAHSNSRHAKEWDSKPCDEKTCCTQTCCAYFWCRCCTLLCGLPHHFAAMARRIGWRGAGRSVENTYATNERFLRKVAWTVFGLLLLYCFVVIMAFKCTFKSTYSAVVVGPNLNQHYVTGHVCSIAVPLLVSNVLLGIPLAVMSSILIYFAVLLRFKMRKALNIKASYFTCCGDVGDFMEDVFCMTNCFSCAMSQMSQEVDTELEFCSGSDPRSMDSGVVHFDV